MSVISAVLVHVADTHAGLEWYTRAFPEAVRAISQPSGFEYLQIGTVQLEIVQADEKVGSGASGSVVYWSVADLGEKLDFLRSMGAVLYRGPMVIDGDLSMCQLRDPWGNCIGLRGPSR